MESRYLGASVYFLPHILNMKSYHPPLSGRWESGSHLLDFNERLKPVHDSVLKAMKDWVDSGASWCYPEYDGLVEAIAHYAKADPAQVFIGNGSDQLLDCLFRAVVAPGETVLLPSPSFAMYRQCADLVEANMVTYSLLSEDPLAELSKGLSAGGVRMAVVCQPNNPTGTLLDVGGLRALIQEYPSVWFIVDEAYVEFSGATCHDRDCPLENLVITRTFSKAFGLAALRLGYMMASEDMLEQCGKIRGPYDINRLAVVAALASFEHVGDVEDYVKEVMADCKPKVEKALGALGCPALPSRANFLLIKSPPDGLKDHLISSGFRVRAMSQPELKGAIRISVGHREVTESFLAALAEFR
jgi:histidinol-phosphate aminotransferase